MSFEPKKRENIEMDKLNIKSHLNTSLEVEGITVSEDLISRTMDAIRLNKANNPDMSKDNVDNKKLVFFRHTRALVMIAAAALILVVGLNALRALSPIGMKSDMSESKNSTSYDDAGNTEMYITKQFATEEDSADYGAGNVQGELGSDVTTTGIIDKDDAEGAKKENEQSLDMLMETKSDEEESGVDERMTPSGQYMIAFTEIAAIGPGEVSTITITAKTTGETIIISNQAQIDRFYSVMEKHYFIQATEDDTATLYVVSIASEDRDSQLLIGETAITADNTHNDITSHSIFIAADHNIFIKDIMDLSVE